MEIRLIFSDIDGTVLPPGGRVSEATKRAVRACRARGVEFVPASGRWYPSAREIARDELGVEDGYMIVANGGAVVRGDGEILMENALSEADARKIFEVLRGAPVMINSYVRDAILRLETHRFSRALPEKSARFGDRSYEVLADDEAAFMARAFDSPYKMEAYADDPAPLNELRRALAAAGFSVSSAFDCNLEIAPKGGGKGAAAAWLARCLGVARDSVMAFGDYTNDLAMFASAGWPVAMGNAPEEVRRAARIVAPRCDADGVAKVLRQYVLGDEEK